MLDLEVFVALEQHKKTILPQLIQAICETA